MARHEFEQRPPSRGGIADKLHRINIIATLLVDEAQTAPQRPYSKIFEERETVPWNNVAAETSSSDPSRTLMNRSLPHAGPKSCVCSSAVLARPGERLPHRSSIGKRRLGGPRDPSLQEMCDSKAKRQIWGR